MLASSAARTAESPYLLGMAPTLLGDSGELVPSSAAASTTAPISSSRFTVLPRAEGEGAGLRLVREERARYEPVRHLASGGMGEVILMNDHDIARPVAVKRLLPEVDDAGALFRFVEEIRTIGQLEHPNIVPIHDVGVDDQGRYFFVMKYVEGETLATVLDRLRAGDPDYHRRYTVQRRLQICIDVLHALSFAHARGILHRDIKPANVMVGRFGEVVVMDWGIAKAWKAAEAAVERAAPPGSGARERPLATRAGAYVGTPLYMAPEQAIGDNDKLDARTDLYSVAVLLAELCTLRHYLGDQPSVEATLAAIVGGEVDVRRLVGDPHPHQPPPPIELAYTIRRGLEKDPARRFQSAQDMIEEIQDVIEGRGAVHCQATFTKRALREAGRFVDRRPHAALLAALGVLGSVAFTGATLVHAILG